MVASVHLQPILLHQDTHILKVGPTGVVPKSLCRMECDYLYSVRPYYALLSSISIPRAIRSERISKHRTPFPPMHEQHQIPRQHGMPREVHWTFGKRQ